MTSRLALSGAALAASLALAPRPALAAPSESPARDDYAVDEAGQSMRVAFDPGRRVALGVGWSFAAEQPGRAEPASLAVSSELAFRHRVVFAGEGIVWKLSHDVARASLTSNDGRLGIIGEAYSLQFLRWSEDGSIVVPTTPPHRLGFPLGLGFDVGAGSVDLIRGGDVRGEVGVARGALLFDFVRSPEHGAVVTLGVGPRYAVRIDGHRPLDHVVAPFSQPELALRFEGGRGHHVVTANAGGGYAWSARQGGGAQARAGASYELVVAAVNDAPLSVLLDTRLRYDDPPLPGRFPWEITGGANLVLGLPLPRSHE